MRGLSVTTRERKWDKRGRRNEESESEDERGGKSKSSQPTTCAWYFHSLDKKSRIFLFSLHLDESQRLLLRYSREVCRVGENRWYPGVPQQGLQTVGFPQLELGEKDFCPPVKIIIDVWMDLLFKLSCYNSWDPYWGPPLTGVRRAVITADWESARHHSSCEQTTEGKASAGDRRHDTDQYALKDKQTHFIEGVW